MIKYRYAVSAAVETPMSAPLPLNGNIEDIIKTAAKLGYDGIELHTRENADLDYDHINALLKENSVKLVNIVTGRLNTVAGLSLLDADGGEKALLGLKQYIDMASRFEADIVLGWAKGKIKDESTKERDFELLASNLKILDEYASKKNVKINIELINRYETNIFNNAKQLADFLQKYDLKNCYAHIDTFHMNIEEDDFEKAIKTCGKHLGYVHVADNQRHYPGSGTIDFKALLTSLDKAGYKGFINVECLPIPDRITAAKKALEYMKKTEKEI